MHLGIKISIHTAATSNRMVPFKPHTSQLCLRLAQQSQSSSRRRAAILNKRNLSQHKHCGIVIHRYPSPIHCCVSIAHSVSPEDHAIADADVAAAAGKDCPAFSLWAPIFKEGDVVRDGQGGIATGKDCTTTPRAFSSSVFRRSCLLKP
jgi:hypothetical protein